LLASTRYRASEMLMVYLFVCEQYTRLEIMDLDESLWANSCEDKPRT